MKNAANLPPALAAILNAVEAGDEQAYGDALQSELHRIEMGFEEDEYVDGMDVDALMAAFKQHGFNTIPQIGFYGV